MTTIVIAALALLVLVVLVLIFTGRLNLWNRGIDETGACATYCKTFGKIDVRGILIEEGIQPTDRCIDESHQHIPGITINDGTRPYYCCCE